MSSASSVLPSDLVSVEVTAQQAGAHPQTSLTRSTFPVLYPVLAPERGPRWQTGAQRRNLRISASGSLPYTAELGLANQTASLSPSTWRRLSGNVFLLPELRELAPEHLLGLDHVVKPVAPGLGGVGDGVVRDPEDELAESPGDELVQAIGTQPIFLGHLLPDVALVGHHLHQRDRQGRRSLHTEVIGEAGPEVLPSEVVAVGDIEDLVAAP